MRLRAVLACIALTATACLGAPAITDNASAPTTTAEIGTAASKIAGSPRMKPTTTVEQSTTTTAPKNPATTAVPPSTEAPAPTTTAPRPPRTTAPPTTAAPTPPPGGSGITHMFFINDGGMPSTGYLDQLAAVSASWRAAGKGRVVVADQNLRFFRATDQGRAYLDYAASLGLGVVWPLDYDQGGSEITTAEYRAMINAFDSHPALVGWYTLDDYAGSSVSPSWIQNYDRSKLTKPTIGTHIGHTDTGLIKPAGVVGTTSLLMDIERWGPYLDVAGIQWYPINTGNDWGKTLELLPEVAAQTAAWAPTVGAQPIVATEFGKWGVQAPTQAQLATAVRAITGAGVRWIGWWELSAGNINDLRAVFG